MRLSRAEVAHIAELAKLGLSSAEEEAFQEQLSAILEYFGRLQELDTDAIPPTATTLPVHSVMRPDAPGPCMPREETLMNAPHAEGGFFRIWAVLEE
ncbi:MAG: Asp-tRNA(Asn)/Glu-tRNA(Gln) amidotransferase subunit GatC [Anaerolineae bacterium]